MLLFHWVQDEMESTAIEKPKKHPRKQLPYLPYVKNIDPNAHIQMFKSTTKTDGEIEDEDIANMFLFTLRDIIFKWGQNSLREHPNCMFMELE
jgi:hypothetical protein